MALPIAALAIILVAGLAVATEPQPEGLVSTAFTYQGRLASDGGDPIDDNCDFQFGLWDDPDAGSPVGPALNLPGVAVADGLFTVKLDFGEVFDGTALWLEVAVQCTGDPGYTTLTPRQALTAAPYAVYAVNADMVDGSDASAFAPAVHGHWVESWTGTGTGLTLAGGTTGLSGNGTTYGVYGRSDSDVGIGVYGLNSADTGPTYGVYGESKSTYGTGVYGYRSSTIGGGSAVFGRNDSPYGTGVLGTSHSTVEGSRAYGVMGISYSRDGYGGWFEANTEGNATTAQAGVYAKNDSSSGWGVAGHNASAGTGVGAWSNSGHLIQGYDGDYPGGTLRFYVTNGGTVFADDGFYTFNPVGSGGNTEYRTLYGMMGAGAWAEDFGSATLKDGKATVTIDPIFAQTVNLAVEYHVYLTPVCSELIVMAVTGKGPESFTVQGATLDGKPSGCAFDYRIVAKQRGYEDQRLEKVDIPEPVEVGREEIDTPGVAGPEPEGGR